MTASVTPDGAPNFSYEVFAGTLARISRECAGLAYMDLLMTGRCDLGDCQRRAEAAVRSQMLRELQHLLELRETGQCYASIERTMRAARAAYDAILRECVESPGQTQ